MKLKIKIDRQAKIPIYSQIKEAILAAIEKNELTSGTRVPAIGTLANDLSINHATVKRAYAELTDMGHLASYVGRGTFVTKPDLTSDPISDPDPSRDLTKVAKHHRHVAAKRLRCSVSDSLETLTLLARRPGLIHFTAGVPCPTIAERNILAQLAASALKNVETNKLGEYGPHGGLHKLRAAIAKRYSSKGFKLTAENVMITSGSQQAISIMAQKALEDERRVICEMPCYMGIPRAFAAVGHWVETIIRDEEGPIPSRLEQLHSKTRALLYCCPRLHNPMGTDLSSQRALLLSQWAQKDDNIIVADHIFNDLYFGETPPSRLTEETPLKNLVVVGSFSKSFMCGLRIGWLISSKERVSSLLSLKRAIDISCPPLMQAIALELITSGSYDKHLVKARAHYFERKEATVNALAKYMDKSVTWTNPPGGFHMWVNLPAGYSSLALFLLAVERGVGIIPGPTTDVDSRFLSSFRLSYAKLRPEQITEGVQMLADAVNELLATPPQEAGMGGFGDFM